MTESSADVVRRLARDYGAWFNRDERLAQGRLTGRLYPFKRLFSPIRINRLQIKNRIVMGPMGNISMAEETGRPGNRMVCYFAERARGGVGLITSGLVPVSHGIDPAVTEPGGVSCFPRIDRSRSVFAGWRDIASACHGFGAHSFIQLTAGLGRVGSPQCLLTKHRLPVSASWNPNFYMPSVPCRPLSDHECHRIVNAAGQAAVDAQEMKIDGVCLHGHEGYLLDQFTNPAFSRRRLGRYCRTGWQHFGPDMVREIRKRTGSSYPIMYRIELTTALHETYGTRMKSERTLREFRRERTTEMTLDFMANLVRAGVDIFDVDLGCYDNWWLPHPPSFMPPGCFLEPARIAREYLRKNDIKSNAGLEVPVVAVGKLGFPDLCEQALRDEACDMVMLARPLLADPEWPKKAFSNRIGEIVPCIGDQEGCVNEFVLGGHPQCSVNPRAGFEDLLSGVLVPAGHARRIAVVGAGPCGVACARAAAERGHKVFLFEQQAEVGGMLVPGSVPKIKFDVANYVGFLQDALDRAARDLGLELHLSTPATASELKQEGFDVVVTCTGGEPMRLATNGADRPVVLSAVDLLRNPGLLGAAQQIVVVGGGSVGCETAFWLAGEFHRHVTVIEILPHFMKGNCTANRGYLIHFLEARGAKLLNCARLQAVTANGVSIVRNVSPTVPNPYVTWAPLVPENIRNPLARPIRLKEVEETLLADLVVLAIGLKPNSRLYEDCMRLHVVPEIHNIGDSFTIARVFEAERAGYALGRQL